MYITHYLISALFAILFLAACSSDPATATLDRAETLMEQYPDSALAMLDTLSPPTSAGENARYALLYSQALDKNHIDVADDSLISIAVNYYENSNDLQRHMLSQYYHARILYNKKSYPRSLLAHHKSLKCAEELGDDFWCGRNAGQISTIYYDFYHSSDAFNYAQLSYEYLKKSGRQPFLNYAILELSHAYYEQESYDNALRFAKNALDSALKYNDKELYICARGIGADCHYYLGQYDNAINDYLDLLDIEYRADIIGLLGLSYLNSNQLEKAAKLRTDTIESDAIRFLLLKSEINKRKGDYKSALSLVENVMFRNDSVLEMSLNQGLSSELSNYYLFDNKIKDLELANLKMTYFITISVIVILLACITITILKMKTRQKHIIERNLGIAQNLREILTLKEAESQNNQKKIVDLLTSKFEIMDSLCASYYENSATKGLKRKISDEVENIIRDLMSDERIAELENILNTNDSNIISSLRKELPQIKEADYRLFIYSALGFSNSAIALFLQEHKIESIYNRKARLKTKIKKLDSSQKNKYLMYLAR
ncbi:MAG: hypothetical protein K2G47_04450 [Muribaculum sp.]|nr:hypothetical protein [Muribaculum sp.]